MKTPQVGHHVQFVWKPSNFSTHCLENLSTLLVNRFYWISLWTFAVNASYFGHWFHFSEYLSTFENFLGLSKLIFRFAAPPFFDRTILNLRLNIRCTIVALKCLHPLVIILTLLNLIFLSLFQAWHFTTAGILLVRHIKSPLRGCSFLDSIRSLVVSSVHKECVWYH